MEAIKMEEQKPSKQASNAPEQPARTKQAPKRKDWGYFFGEVGRVALFGLITGIFSAVGARAVGQNPPPAQLPPAPPLKVK